MLATPLPRARSVAAAWRFLSAGEATLRSPISRCNRFVTASRLVALCVQGIAPSVVTRHGVHRPCVALHGVAVRSVAAVPLRFATCCSQAFRSLASMEFSEELRNDVAVRSHHPLVPAVEATPRSRLAGAMWSVPQRSKSTASSSCRSPRLRHRPTAIGRGRAAKRSVGVRRTPGPSPTTRSCTGFSSTSSRERADRRDRARDAATPCRDTPFTQKLVLTDAGSCLTPSSPAVSSGRRLTEVPLSPHEEEPMQHRQIGERTVSAIGLGEMPLSIEGQARPRSGPRHHPRLTRLRRDARRHGGRIRPRRPRARPRGAVGGRGPGHLWRADRRRARRHQGRPPASGRRHLDGAWRPRLCEAGL